MATVGVEGLEE